MLKFEWNALRVGDQLTVHDPSHPDLQLVAGTVVMVETTRAGRAANGIGISIASGDGGHRVIWPSYMAAHQGPPELGDCWRCDALAEPTARGPVERATAATVVV